MRSLDRFPELVDAALRHGDEVRAFLNGRGGEDPSPYPPLEVLVQGVLSQLPLDDWRERLRLVIDNEVAHARFDRARFQEALLHPATRRIRIGRHAFEAKYGRKPVILNEDDRAEVLRLSPSFSGSEHAFAGVVARGLSKSREEQFAAAVVTAYSYLLTEARGLDSKISLSEWVGKTDVELNELASAARAEVESE